jgi:hypothetical protein
MTTKHPDCQRPAGGLMCALCDAGGEDPCVFDTVDPALLDPSKAIGGGVPTAACNPDDGVCEACQ